MNWAKILFKYLPRAKKIVSDPERMEKLAKESFSLLKGEGKLAVVRREGLLLWKLVKDAITGRYRGLKKRNLLLIVAGLMYLVNPMDLLPDFLFGLGFFDDVGVLMYVFKKLDGEIKAYEAWRGEEWPTAADSDLYEEASDLYGEETYGATMEEAPDLEGYQVIDYDE